MTISSSDKFNERQIVQMLCSDNLRENQTAWTQLYTHSYPRIRSLALKRGWNLEQAAESFADAFEALCNNLRNGKFEHRSSIVTYLTSIFFNMYCKQYVKAGKARAAELEFWKTQISEPDYDPTRDILLKHVNKALMQRLKPDCRKVLIEFYFNRRSIREIAIIFNITEQAAKNKKMRCQKYLLEIFREMDINPDIIDL